ncbi:MAG: acetate/propionate family kinase [Gaiellales bacterium]
MRLLAVNVGSTSFKYKLYQDGDEIARGNLQQTTGEAALEAIRGLIASAGALDAVAFKAVVGGPRFTGTHLVDAEVLGEMRRFAAAAPAHNPPYVAAMELFRQAAPGVPLVAAFETAFHRTWPERARGYGVPLEWEERYGIRRYGYHGSSHSYVARRLGELEPDARAAVICHLGGSSSLCAVRDGAAMDASMGFSPQSGVSQANRVGDLDPFALVHLVEQEGLPLTEVAETLVTRGGLAGMSGLSGDLRELLDAEAGGHAGAVRALDRFVYEVQKAAGAMAVAAGGLDALAFTGGMGENSAELRERICAGLGFLGVELDAAGNAAARGVERRISRGRVAVWALPTDEEAILLQRVTEVLR